MSFLPNNYEPPKSSTSDYCKLKDGVTKIRILTSPVIGYQDWDGKTPISTRDRQSPISSDRSPKHFWAMMVWNYEISMIQVLQLTQKSVIDALYALNNDEDWGNPTDYDLKITRSGKDLDTRYVVTPSNKGPISEQIKAELDATVHNLENLFDGKQVIEERLSSDLPF